MSTFSLIFVANIFVGRMDGKSILPDIKPSSWLIIPPYALHIILKARWIFCSIFYHWPRAGIITFGLRIAHFTSAGGIRPGDMCVNSFHAYHVHTPQESFALLWFSTIVATLFGAIHCAGWNFFFLSFTEATIWRISSIIITGVPLGAFLVGIWLRAEYFLKEKNVAVVIINYIVICGTFISLPLYVFARIAVLIEAVISLRNLQIGALTAVSWTLALPHI